MHSTTNDKDSWEAYARGSAEFYVDTRFFTYPEGQRKAKFFENGQHFTDQTLNRVEGRLVDHERAVDIGAGVGRLALPHARAFDEVVAVDVSSTMLKKLGAHADEADIHNIKTYLPDQAWDGAAVSYAYSYFVMQHIVDFETIAFYVRKLANCLKSGGLAQLHFDTRKKTPGYVLRNRLPQFILPENQRKGFRRIRRSADDLRSTFEQYHLEILDEINPDSLMHTYVVKKSV